MRTSNCCRQHERFKILIEHVTTMMLIFCHHSVSKKRYDDVEYVVVVTSITYYSIITEEGTIFSCVPAASR